MQKLRSVSRVDWIYLACVVVGLASVATIRAIEGFGNILWISDIASMLGIFATVAMAKHSPFGYLLFAAANCILLYTTWVQQVYFSFGNFALGIALMSWGFISFYRNKKTDESKNAKKLSKKQWTFFALLYAAVLPAVMVGLWALNSSYFYLDAIAVAGTLTAIILITNQFFEAYYFYIVGNLAAIVMFILLSLENINNLAIVVMFAVFQVTNFIGLATWREIYNKQQNLIIEEKTPQNDEKSAENNQIS